MTDLREFKKVRQIAKQLQDRIGTTPVESLMQGMSQEDAAKMLYCWPLWARGPDIDRQSNPQIEQILCYQNWTHWLVCAGRGWGKSFCGSQWVRYQIESGNMRQIALIARTPADARRVMIEGRSGLLNISPPWFKPIWEPSKTKLTWPNGAVAWVYSSEKPDQLRGPEHDGYWADEMAAWRFLEETWDNFIFGFRLKPRDGRPRGIITTTPRPLKLLRDLVKEAQDSGNKGDVYLTRASTLENAVNWPAKRLADMLLKYQGSRLGAQEIYAQILDDSPGALWTRDDIKTIYDLKAFDLARVVVAVDPQKASQGVGRKAGTEHDRKDKHAPNCSTGIVACARDRSGRGLVLEDRTMDGKPEEWAKVVCDLYEELQADCVVAESNAGGDMVESVIRAQNPNVPVKLVHASRGKAIRAEPISTFYKRKQVFHFGHWPELEDQMCTWDPDKNESPDRVDALVWGFTELLLGNHGGPGEDEFWGREGKGNARDFERRHSDSGRFRDEDEPRATRRRW